jgi:tRNA A-37 threonylcarbamoyl transferase component Bud32
MRISIFCMAVGFSCGSLEGISNKRSLGSVSVAADAPNVKRNRETETRPAVTPEQGDTEGFTTGESGKIISEQSEEIEWPSLWEDTKIILNDLALQGDTGAPIPHLESRRREFVGLNIGVVIATTYTSVVMEGYLSGAGRVAVKYTTDCYKRSRNPRIKPSRRYHPLVNEYELLVALNDSGLTPHVYTLSGPQTLSREPQQSVKLSMEIMTRHGDRCRRLNSVIRYMVEEKVDDLLMTRISTLHDSGRKTVGFLKEILGYGIGLIVLLEKLHSYGIVHGDIHEHNVALRMNEADSQPVVIDFGYGFFFPEQLGDDEESQQTITTLNPVYLSPWHLEGYRIGRRDDVFRVAELLCNLISNRGYMESLQEEEKRAKEAIHRGSDQGILFEKLIGRKTGNIFETALTDWRDIQEDTKMRTIGLLGEWVRIIHDIASPDSEPPYRDLVERLQHIIDSF